MYHSRAKVRRIAGDFIGSQDKSFYTYEISDDYLKGNEVMNNGNVYFL